MLQYNYIILTSYCDYNILIYVYIVDINLIYNYIIKYVIISFVSFYFSNTATWKINITYEACIYGLHYISIGYGLPWWRSG